MSENMHRETALIEAILFSEAESMGEDDLCRVSGLPEEAVREALGALGDRYASADSGIELFRIDGKVKIAPKREYWDSLRDRYGWENKGKISRAAMETLAIIAYSQPVTRAEIKALRGVSPDNMIHHLLHEKNLIREMGKKDVPGKPVQYGTTKEFLRHFRLDSIADLPRLGEGDLDRFELETNQ